MHFRVRIHHWVLWWFYVGVICGAIAVVSILARDLTRTEERVILVIGVLFWRQGGLVCYAHDSFKSRSRMRSLRAASRQPLMNQKSDTLPPKY